MFCLWFFFPPKFSPQSPPRPFPPPPPPAFCRWFAPALRARLRARPFFRGGGRGAAPWAFARRLPPPARARRFAQSRGRSSRERGGAGGAQCSREPPRRPPAPRPAPPLSWRGVRGRGRRPVPSPRLRGLARRAPPCRDAVREGELCAGACGRRLAGVLLEGEAVHPASSRASLVGEPRRSLKAWMILRRVESLGLG